MTDETKTEAMVDKAITVALARTQRHGSATVADASGTGDDANGTGSDRSDRGSEAYGRLGEERVGDA
jgi:hypothetical protein